jgi:hypothetical protein
MNVKNRFFYVMTKNGTPLVSILAGNPWNNRGYKLIVKVKNMVLSGVVVK